MDKAFYKNAKDTLKSMENLDPVSATPQQFAIMGACLAFLADKDNAGIPAIDTTTATISDMETVQQEDVHGKLLDEITDSEYYYSRYIETQKKEYLQMAKDEARHFEMLSKLIREDNPHYDFGELLTRYRALLAKLA